MIHVEVKRVSGEALRLDIECERNCSDLKAMISSHWQVPAACQELTLDEHVLNDLDRRPLSVHCAVDDPNLSLTMLVSFQKVLQLFRKKDKDSKLAALDAVARAGTLARHAEDVVTAVISCLPHGDLHITAAVIKALTAALGKGSASTTAILSSGLLDGASASGDALQALAGVANKGDEVAIDAVFRLLSQGHVRTLAVKVLVDIVESGDERVISKVAEIVEEQWRTRTSSWTYVEALVLLMERDDQRAIDAIAACLLARANVTSATMASKLIISKAIRDMDMGEDVAIIAAKLLAQIIQPWRYCVPSSEGAHSSA